MRLRYETKTRGPGFLIFSLAESQGSTDFRGGLQPLFAQVVSVKGLGLQVQGSLTLRKRQSITPIMENQVEKKMENEMKTRVI